MNAELLKSKKVSEKLIQKQAEPSLCTFFGSHHAPNAITDEDHSTQNESQALPTQNFSVPLMCLKDICQDGEQSTSDIPLKKSKTFVLNVVFFLGKLFIFIYFLRSIKCMGRRQCLGGFE